MTKYNLRKIEGGQVLGTFETKQEAADWMQGYITKYNDWMHSSNDYLTPFDFTIEEIEIKEINEVITNYEKVREYLGGKPNADLTVAKKLMQQKLQVNLEINELADAMVRAVEKLPILTEAEVDELRDASEDMLDRMVDKGCWLGLGFVRNADQDLSLLSAAHGNFTTLVLMVSEAMDEDPVLEKVFLLALALKKSMDKMDETEDNEDEDYNEEEE